MLGGTPIGSEDEKISATASDGQGRLVGRRYRLMSPVGRGGMGMVWHAHDVLLDRDVAVKELILPYGLDHAGTQVAHRRMMREARSAARLSHPGIVTVHDVVEEDGRPWIVMELVRAWSLEQAVRQSGPLPVPQAAEIGIRVLDALRHAHASGILHRDVKPGNVLLTSDRVVLTDFGIAAIEGDVTITQTGLLMGSPAYIPPERLSGRPYTQASDLWSFGATLYAAVEGRPPYEGPDAVAVLGAILTQEPGRPQRAGALITAIEGLLRKEPADRMTAAQVSDLLERVLRSHGSPTPGREPVTEEPSPALGGSVPMHLISRPDRPAGPMPSRIIETPSGPVRVPYDPPVEPRADHAALSGLAGGRPDPPSAPGRPVAGAAVAGIHAGVHAGGHGRGYDALRSPVGDLGRPPPEGLSGEFPGATSFGPSSGARPPGPPASAAEIPTSAEAAPWPIAPQGGHDAARDSKPSAVPGRSGGRRGSRRRAPDDGAWMRDGRPTRRLLLAGGVAALVTVLVVLVTTLLAPSSSGAPGTGASPTSSDPVSPSRVTSEVPEGYQTLSEGRVSAALPKGWTVKTRDGGAVTFSGPKDSGQGVAVTEVPVGDPMSALERADRKGLDEYTEIGMAPVQYGTWRAADWEYTYVQPGGAVPMHGLTRYVAVNGQTAYLITFTVQDLDWERSDELRQIFFDTFASAS
ncbi:protein kinase [Streptosporangium sp. NPDC006007]|uniref:serine/threonine-protein kinase n=1 Tax=Streptosporangium sp. NPDC006007 TaxID=3154575 RepID=UPI0033A4804E